MQKNQKLVAIVAIVAGIAALTVDRAKLSTLIAGRQAARQKITGDITVAAGAADAAVQALDAAITRDAMGESEAGEVDAAREAVAQARNGLVLAREREEDARDLLAAENGLTARIAPLADRIADLQGQRDAEVIECLKVELHARVEAYTRAAEATIARFADVIAMDDYFTLDLKLSQDIRTPDVADFCLPSFLGHPSSAPAYLDLLKSARAFVLRDLTYGMDAGRIAPSPRFN